MYSYGQVNALIWVKISSIIHKDDKCEVSVLKKSNLGGGGGNNEKDKMITKKGMKAPRKKKLKPYNLASRVLLSLEQFAGGDKCYKNKK